MLSNNEHIDSSSNKSSREVLVMMVSTTLLEDQVSIIAMTLKDLIKSIQEKESFRYELINTILNKIEDLSILMVVLFIHLMVIDIIKSEINLERKIRRINKRVSLH